MKKLILLTALIISVIHVNAIAETSYYGSGGPIRTSNGGVIEDVVPSIVTTEVDHWIIHVGASYVASDTITVPSASNVEFLVRNNTSTGTHMTEYRFVSTQGDAEVVMYEASTVAFVGTTTTPRNSNRTYADVAEVTVFSNASTTAFGLQLEHDLIVGGKQIGGSGGSAHEWVLEQNTAYIINYINNSGQADVVSFHFDFLEVNLLP